MNVSEAIDYLGSANAARGRPKRFDEIDDTLPYFRVIDRRIEAFNYATHDNAERMPYVTSWLSQCVFPHVKGNLDGYYSIQLHDSYSYLEDGKNYDGVLCFGKVKNERGPLMLPDCYHIGDWAGKYRNFADPYSWEQKKDVVAFSGTTTGKRDPLKNERISTCLWAIDKPWCELKITGIAQIDREALVAVPKFDKIIGKRLPFMDQFKSKYMLVIDGNASKWDVDCYFSNSLAFAMPSTNMLWYYPLLSENVHYAPVTLENMQDKFEYYGANPADAKRIVANAKALSAELFKEDTARKYAIALFEAISDNK